MNEDISTSVFLHSSDKALSESVNDFPEGLIRGEVVKGGSQVLHCFEGKCGEVFKEDGITLWGCDESGVHFFRGELEQRLEGVFGVVVQTGHL